MKTIICPSCNQKCVVLSNNAHTCDKCRYEYHRKRYSILYRTERNKRLEYQHEYRKRKKEKSSKWIGKFIYFLIAENGLLYIGYTINIRDRYITHRAQSPCGLQLYYYCDGTKKLENDLHLKYKPFLVPQKRSWYFPNKPMLDEIKELKSYYGDNEDLINELNNINKYGGTDTPWMKSKRVHLDNKYVELEHYKINKYYKAL
jgi:hypothetical protein